MVLSTGLCFQRALLDQKSTSALFPGVGGGRRGAVNKGLFMYTYLELALTTCQYFSHFVVAGTGGF